jgi:hypothetical protein
MDSDGFTIVRKGRKPKLGAAVVTNGEEVDVDAAREKVDNSM